ncbi:hypothetical protein PLICRDRAFT_41411 [Plicaturopsis crispa FD-325 SS-3]|nr:hypothetical protein PLICRDRAFT_41411 [Plicaturopsis crispa FD-325 SS-3]
MPPKVQKAAAQKPAKPKRPPPKDPVVYRTTSSGRQARVSAKAQFPDTEDEKDSSKNKPRRRKKATDKENTDNTPVVPRIQPNEFTSRVVPTSHTVHAAATKPVKLELRTTLIPPKPATPKNAHGNTSQPQTSMASNHRKLTPAKAKELRELRSPFVSPSDVPRAPARQPSQSAGLHEPAQRLAQSASPQVPRDDEQDLDSEQEEYRRYGEQFELENSRILAERQILAEQQRKLDNLRRRASIMRTSQPANDKDMPENREPTPEKDVQAENHAEQDYDSDSDASGDLETGDDLEDEEEEYDDDEAHSGDKRGRSPSSPDRDPPARKAHRSKGSNGRPKAADYDSAVKEVLGIAIELYRIDLSVENPFPKKMEELTWAKRAWSTACRDHCDVNIRINGDILRLITNRGSHLRGELKTKAKALTPATYGFKDSKNLAVISRNRQIARDLKTALGFTYRKLGSGDPNPQERKGLYQHPIIQTLINTVWYKDCGDQGITWPEYTPFPLPALALTLTAIECAVDEWVSGSHVTTPFSALRYRPMHSRHVAALHRFGEATKEKDILAILLSRVSEDGRVHAKVEHVVEEEEQAIPHSAFEASLREFANSGRWNDGSDDDDE